MIDTDGSLKKVGGPSFHWMALDQADGFAGKRLPSTPSEEVIAVGSQPTAIVASDFPVGIGEDGSLFYPERVGNRHVRINKFTPNGEKSVFATLPNDIQWVKGIAFGPDGSLYFTDHKKISRIDRRGNVSVVANDVRVAPCTAIPGIEPESQPALRGLAIADDGTMYVAASGCGALIRISPKGEVKTIVRTEPPWSPTAVAISPKGIYVLEYVHTVEEIRRAWVPRVRKISPDGTTKIVAEVKR